MKKEIEDESIYYGFLVMVVCDENGMVYDIWFYPASYYVNRWRKIKTFVVYLYAYAIGYSFLRKSKLWR